MNSFLYQLTEFFNLLNQLWFFTQTYSADVQLAHQSKKIFGPHIGQLFVGGNCWRGDHLIAFHQSHDAVDISTFKGFYDIAALKEFKSRHALDGVSTHHILGAVNVHFTKVDVLLGGRQLLNLWRNVYTRATPSGEKVDDSQFWLRNIALQLRQRRNKLYAHF